MIVNTIFSEATLVGEGYEIIIYTILLILFGPPMVLALIGWLLFRKKNQKAGKIFFILAGVYLVVGLGVCGAVLV